MALRRRWFLVLTVFALGAGTARAGFREERDFNAAKSAFQDHLWAQAETAFASFVRKHTGSPRIPEALVLEAQAQFRQGKFTDALTLLTTQKTQAATLADQFDYWLGEVQAAMRNYPAATATFLALPQHYPASPLRLRATVEAAAALAADHHWDQVARLLADPAGGFVSEANQRPPADDLVVRGRLLLAEARTRANDFSEAARELNRLYRAAFKGHL